MDWITWKDGKKTRTPSEIAWFAGPNFGYVLRAVENYKTLFEAVEAAIRTPNIYTTDQQTGETPYELMKKAIAKGE